MDAGKDDEARIELEKILAADPRSVDARVQLGFLHGRAKRHDEAIRVLQEAVNIEPKRAELFLYLGTAYFRRPAVRPRARRAPGRAQPRRQQQGPGTSRLGVVYEKQERFDDAVRAFRRVLVIDPKHAESYNYIGYMYAERGQNLTEAVQLIQRALDLDPENGYFIDSLGWAYYQQGKLRGRAPASCSAPSTSPRTIPVILDHLGDAYLKTGSTDDAIAAWERALADGQAEPTAGRRQEEARRGAREAAPGPRVVTAQGRAEVSSPPGCSPARSPCRGGCASLPPRQPSRPRSWPPAPPRGALAEFRDLRTLADITIRRGERTERLSGVLLLRAPASLRFEALSPFGVAPPRRRLRCPDASRSGRCSTSAPTSLPRLPDANRRWLGLALGAEDLVALLSGRVLPLAIPSRARCCRRTTSGPRWSSRPPTAASASGSTRTSGRPRQVEWTGGARPGRLRASPPDEPPALTLATLDGKLEVRVRYQTRT